MKIKKGDFITILHWVGINDKSYIGDCMEVKVIDYPFIRVINHKNVFGKDLITLNLEKLKIKKLSKEFILSIIPDYKGRLPNDTEANNFDNKILISWISICVCTIFYIL